MVYGCAYDVFGKTFVKQSHSISDIRKKNEWFDDNCKNTRKDFHVDRNRFQRYPSDPNRQLYVNSRNKYNATKRKAKMRYKRLRGQELRKMAKTNPREFWSKVKPKYRSKCAADRNDIFEHFKHVLGSESTELSEEIKTLIDSIDLDEIKIEELDSEFTEEEISFAIRKMKRGKSTGTDGLSGEMFITDTQLFSAVLKVLFNNIFELSIYPDNWTEGIVVPVPKKVIYQIRIIIDQ